jgi:PAS domain S-box-containing protein
MLDNVTGLDFASIVDTLDIGIVVLDRRACVVGWNDWMARVTGQSRRAALGAHLCDMFPELRGARLLAVIEDAFEAGSSSILTHSLNKLLPLRGDGGQELLHNIVVRPISCGGSDFCLLQINDVTISVTRERVLRDRQNSRYHAIVDSAPDAIITTRLDGTIEWMNGAAEQVFGYAPSELLGRRIDVLLGADADLSSVFAEAAGNSTRPLPVVGRRKQGEETYFDVSFGHWRADERVFVTTIWRDVTERIVAEAALQRSNEELEARVAERTREREAALYQLFESQKVETIGQLTGGVAHDFNNLLGVILGSLTMLKKGLPVDPRTSRLLEGAIQGAERGATLTRRLLAFARRQELRLEAVELQQLVPDMLDFLRQSAGPTVSIAVDIPPDVHPVRIDANQLELAVMNLVVNARDAMPQGGALTIACQNAAASEETDRPRRTAARRLRSHKRCRHWPGHEQRDAGKGHGTVLYDEGSRQGHRFRPFNGPWSRGASWRRRAHLQSIGRGNGGDAVAASRAAGRCASGGGTANAAGRGRRPKLARSRGGRRCPGQHERGRHVDGSRA